MDDVEKVARALYQRRATVDSPWLTGWENAPENTRNILRGDATAAIAAMEGWRPISETPERAMPVLLFYPTEWKDGEGKPFSFGEIRDYVERIMPGWFDGKNWYQGGAGRDCFEFGSDFEVPTHYKPLPAPPQHGGE